MASGASRRLFAELTTATSCIMQSAGLQAELLIQPCWAGSWLSFEETAPISEVISGYKICHDLHIVTGLLDNGVAGYVTLTL